MKGTIVIEFGKLSCLREDTNAPCRFGGTRSFGRIDTCQLFNNYPLEPLESGPEVGKPGRCSFCIGEFGPWPAKG